MDRIKCRGGQITELIQKRLYDYLIEYEDLCIAVHVYITQTGDLLCERNPDIRANRNQCMREILDNFERKVK